MSVDKLPGSLSSPPTAAERLLGPFQEFARLEASGGILLLFCTVGALVWSNSPWRESYSDLWHTTLTVGFGSAALSKPLLLWINDGLMAIFFFVVGLEIKREILVGELATARQAALPLAGAVGGMIVPAIFYAALNAGGEGAAGWGIPMATDIAFALGVLALLGSRVDIRLKIFLTALAIADDLGAVLVIALFYTADISWASLAAAVLILALLLIMNRLGLQRPLVYALFGVAVWLAFLKSGVHATVAGVLLAMTVPSSVRLNPAEFLAQSRAVLNGLEKAAVGASPLVASHHQQAAIHTLERACEQTQPPLQRLEHALHPWVTFLILPVFALANAGVSLAGEVTNAVAHPVALGVILGLVGGKPLGITLFSWLAVRSGLATLPGGMNWRHIHGAGWLAGIGFTMSLFIAGLAFGESQLLEMAKVGILLASVIAVVVGSLLLGLGKRSGGRETSS
jgi:NhaA family Na+:H+ antiporter